MVVWGTGSGRRPHCAGSGERVVLVSGERDSVFDPARGTHQRDPHAVTAASSGNKDSLFICTSRFALALLCGTDRGWARRRTRATYFGAQLIDVDLGGEAAIERLAAAALHICACTRANFRGVLPWRTIEILVVHLAGSDIVISARRRGFYAECTSCATDGRRNELRGRPRPAREWSEPRHT